MLYKIEIILLRSETYMLLGHVIMERRKKLGYSQAELAKGICTQATISKMENKNIPPLVDILIKICMRLHLTPNQVLSEFTNPVDDSISELFNQVNRNIDSMNYKEAKRIFKKINIKKLKAERLPLYHYDAGMIAFNYDHNIDDAQFEFNLVLQNHNEINDDDNFLIEALSLNGLGLVYEGKQDKNKAKYYFDKAYMMITDLPLKTTSELNGVLAIIRNVAEFYAKCKDYRYSNQLITKSLQRLSDIHPVPAVEYAYLSMARNLYHIDNDRYQDQINTYVNYAEGFASFNHDENCLKLVKKYHKTHKFD